MKRILYIHQYFKTPEEGGAIRSYYLAKSMVSRGHHVDMVTSFNGNNYKVEDIEGIKVHYLPVRYSNKFSYLRRSISFIRYVISSALIIRKLARPDIVYATSTPLTVGIISLWLKWSKKVPYVFEVRDLWPEAPIQLGIVKLSLLKHLYIAMEKKIYRNANHIVALSPGIKKGVLQRSNHSKVSVIPNMSDVDFFDKSRRKAEEIKTFKIGYFGAFGRANNITFILDIAQECLHQKPDVEFVLAGEGSELSKMELEAKKRHLHNIRFVGFINRFTVRDLMSEVDACITSFLKLPVLQTNSPNKFFDGLAAGKLMIVNTEGWLKDLVEQHRCGIYIDPEKPETFISLIKPYTEDRQMLRTAQNNALKLAIDQFLKEKLTGEVCGLLAKA